MRTRIAHEKAVHKEAWGNTWFFICKHLAIEVFVSICTVIAGGIQEHSSGGNMLNVIEKGVYIGLIATAIMFFLIWFKSYLFASSTLWKIDGNKLDEKNKKISELNNKITELQERVSEKNKEDEVITLLKEHHKEGETIIEENRMTEFCDHSTTTIPVHADPDPMNISAWYERVKVTLEDYLPTESIKFASGDKLTNYDEIIIKKKLNTLKEIIINYRAK